MLYEFPMHITSSFTGRALRPPLMSFAAAGGSLLAADANATIADARAASQSAVQDATQAIQGLREAREAIETWPATDDPGDLDAVIDHLDEIATEVHAEADKVEALLSNVRGRITDSSAATEVLDRLLADFVQAIDTYLSELGEVRWAVMALRAERQPSGPATPAAGTAEELEALLDSIKRGGV